MHSCISAIGPVIDGVFKNLNVVDTKKSSLVLIMVTSQLQSNVYLLVMLCLLDVTLPHFLRPESKLILEMHIVYHFNQISPHMTAMGLINCL